jgi:hypothetical protein
MSRGAMREISVIPLLVVLLLPILAMAAVNAVGQTAGESIPVLGDCADDRSLPSDDVQQQLAAHAGTAAYRQCVAAATELVAMRTKDGAYTYRTSAIASGDVALKAYRATVQNYRTACFTPPGDVETLRSRSGTMLEPSLGFLVAEGSDYPWCSAAKIGRYVLTARHCFARETANVSQVAVPAAMRFALFSSPRMRHTLKVSNDVHPGPLLFDPDAPAQDWLILEIEGRSAKTDAAIAFGTPKRWQQLVVAGADTNALLIHRIDRALGAVGSGAVGHLQPRLQFGPLCRIGVIERNVIFHPCATELGMSGSPVFQIEDNGELTLIGVHLGGSGRLKSFCARKHEREFPNFAVLLPDEVRRTIEALNRRP